MPPSPPLSEADYEAIEAAVMETTRGRWFLAEYARRNRHADTAMLLAALARLEDVLRGAAAGLSGGPEKPEQDVGRDRTDLAMDQAAETDHERSLAVPVDELPMVSAPTCDEDLLEDQTVPALAVPSRPDPLAPLRALSYEERVALFS